MNNSSSNILLHLLRAALGSPSGEAVDLSVLSKADWEEVIDLSFDQGVAAIAVDGLQKSLELALDSPELEDLKYEWLSPSGFSSLTSPSSVATRDSSSKLDLSSRCSIGSHLGN